MFTINTETGPYLDLEAFAARVSEIDPSLKVQEVRDPKMNLVLHAEIYQVIEGRNMLVASHGLFYENGSLKTLGYQQPHPGAIRQRIGDVYPGSFYWSEATQPGPLENGCMVQVRNPGENWR